MKNIIFTFVLITVIAATSFGQTSGVTFLPGLGENQTVWSPMSNDLKQQYVFNERFEYYNGFDAIDTTANGIYIPTGDVVIAHSQGGLLAREVLRDGTTNDFDALITVGTPHTGAPIVTSALNGTASSVLSGWVWDLAVGFYVYGSGQAFQNQVIDFLVHAGVFAGSKFIIQDYIDDNYRNEQGVSDMEPGSSFLSQLNSQPENTLPPARYAIYGDEYFQTPWRLMGSAKSGPGAIEDPTGIQTHHKLLSYYAYLSSVAYGNANMYLQRMLRAQQNYNFEEVLHYRELYKYWSRVALAFHIGFDSLYYRQQYEWSRYVTGSLEPPSAWQPEDGILPKDTQAPAFFDTPDGIDRRLSALGANHIEETAHPKVRDRIEEAFMNDDIDMLEVGEDPPPPFTVGINGPSGLDSGESGTWTAQLSGTEGSVSYQWYTQSVGSNTWSFRGNNSSMTTTFINQIEPPIVRTGQIKLMVTNNGETITEFKNVQVGPAPPPPCGYSTATSESVSINLIPPPGC